MSQHLHFSIKIVLTLEIKISWTKINFKTNSIILKIIKNLIYSKSMQWQIFIKKKNNLKIISKNIFILWMNKFLLKKNI